MKKTKKAITKTTSEKDIVASLEGDQNIGMSKVDPADIRPPMILLIQKSSSTEDFTDSGGNTPKLGQFFHNGKMKILDSFECHILYAEKGTWVNKRKPELGKLPQYRAIGAMADDNSLFAMVFRSSSLYTLSGLFTATKSMKRPMYSLKLTIENKMLENKDGKWWIPVVRKIEKENRASKLMELYELAHGLESKAQTIEEEDVPEESGPSDGDNHE